MNISEQIMAMLYENGASIVGFSDLNGTGYPDMPYGISVAVAIPREVVKSIHNAPTTDYFNAYHEINKKLDTLVLSAEKFLIDNGYKAYAQTVDRVEEYDVFRTKLPHKTVATRAGLGWIGKSALFVTEKYGSAVRLSSLVTDAVLECGQPVTSSKCGDCLICKNACPGNAILGGNWDISTDRDNFFNALACRKKAREIAAEALDKEITLCGKCIESCRYTQRYINSI